MPRRKERPALPDAPLFTVPTEVAGKSVPEKIDFTNQLIIVYMFVTTTPRNFEMTDLSLKEGVLRVSYKVEMSIGDRLHSIKDDVMAYRRCFALVMDKTDITTAEFEER